MIKRFLGAAVAWVGLVLLVACSAVWPAGAQGSLSQQVLALLSRTNVWIGRNTFNDLRIPIRAVPDNTTARLYTDSSANLYYNGVLLASGGGATNPHNLLSTTHPDTVPASPTRGALVIGNATPLWARYQPSVSGCFVQYNGTDTTCATSGATLTSLPAANLTGTIAAISGVNLTNLNASNLASGTVPLARISALTNSQIDAAAAIAYSKLALTGGIVNADVSGSAGIAYSKLSLTNAIVAGDLTAGAVTMVKIAQAGATTGQAIAWDGAAWVPTTISGGGGGGVSSVALSMPAIFSVANSPITSSGTLAVTVATQTANTVWAGPTTGSAAAPSFRALVNADLPTSGVAAATYPSVTVNTRGIVTAASTTVNLATVGGATVLLGANGGTGVANTGRTITLAGNLATTGAFNAVFNIPSSSTWNFPTGGGNLGTVTSIATTSPITGGPITATGTIACATCGVTGSPLSQFASTTSAQLRSVLSDETGSGAAVFADSPVLVTPNIGAATGTSLDLSGDLEFVNLTGTGGEINGTLDIDITGSITASSLTSTGAATGKKVVCVDTGTGLLYASSTGTDCSN